MSKEQKRVQPFSELGNHLKKLRVNIGESLAEVSGAVEIEVESMTAIEKGAKNPGEDILLLLISHFSVKEDVATKLWEQASFDQTQLPHTNMVNDDFGAAKSSVVVMPSDAGIAYTDMVHVTANNYGIVINFMQSNSLSNKPIVVSRVGMSKEHARSIIEVLQKTMDQDRIKSLPPTKPRAKDSKNSKQ